MFFFSFINLTLNIITPTLTTKLQTKINALVIMLITFYEAENQKFPLLSKHFPVEKRTQWTWDRFDISLP